MFLQTRNRNQNQIQNRTIKSLPYVFSLKINRIIRIAYGSFQKISLEICKLCMKHREQRPWTFHLIRCISYNPIWQYRRIQQMLYAFFNVIMAEFIQKYINFTANRLIHSSSGLTALIDRKIFLLNIPL